MPDFGLFDDMDWYDSGIEMLSGVESAAEVRRLHAGCAWRHGCVEECEKLRGKMSRKLARDLNALYLEQRMPVAESTGDSLSLIKKWLIDHFEARSLWNPMRP